MAEYRTRLQIDANELDLEIFRLTNRLDRFAIDHRNSDVREMSINIDAMRWRVRRHMHRKDAEATAA